MKIIEVKSRKDWQTFHRIPHHIYKNDPNWIAPLRKDIEGIFDPSGNDAFRNGEASCFILLEQHGQPVGRIAAFIDHARNEMQEHAIGGIGYFECIDNLNYAFALFDHAANWLENRGAEVIDGPINFGERDKFWGLLVKGFDPPFFQENYQPPYYRNLFESWGFLPYEQVLTFRGQSKNIPVQRLTRVMKRIRESHDVVTKSLDYGQLSKYSADFCEIYNAAFSKYGHFKPLRTEQVEKILDDAKPVVDPAIMAITYFNDQPAAFCALLPDVNKLLRFAGGQLNWWKLPVLLWKKYTTRQFTAKGIGFGIHPEYQNKGAYAAIVAYMTTARNVARYPEIVLTTVRAHNHEAVSVYKKLGVEVDRIHIAYRKPLKSDIPVEPFEFTEKY